MFNYSCVICNDSEEWCSTINLCSKCESIRKIVAVYGVESVINTLEDVFVRTKEPIENRTKAEEKKYNLRKTSKAIPIVSPGV